MIGWIPTSETTSSVLSLHLGFAVASIRRERGYGYAKGT